MVKLVLLNPIHENIKCKNCDVKIIFFHSIASLFSSKISKCKIIFIPEKEFYF